MKELKKFFDAKAIAVIGASRDPNKVGHVVLKNLLDGGFKGEVYPVNPNATEVLSRKSYPSIKDLKGKTEVAVIAVPAGMVMKIIKECNEAGVKNVVILSAGFGEAGNKKLEEELKNYLDKNGMLCIGVNCLGIYDSYNKIDSLFIPRYRLRRPRPGGIGFICQSGAIGAAILDLATERHYAVSKFISYGNATQVDESDLLSYLENDVNTKVICLYLEGIKDGEKFYRSAKRISAKKPIIAIKGGLTEAGREAALSHTGALAGTKEVYLGIFKQAGIIHAESLEEMFDIARIIEKGMVFKGNRIQIITNGGGYGILTADLVAEAKNAKMSKLSSETVRKLKKAFPDYVSIHNPLDLVGDATTERYKLAIDACIGDKNVDAIILIALYQTPLITTDIVEVISEFHWETKKPIIVVSTGGEFTETLSASLEEEGIPTFTFPGNAVHAIDKLLWYYSKK